jgi:hypothetical protein
MYLSSDCAEGRQLRKVRRVGRLCPVTFETMKIGHSLMLSYLYCDLGAASLPRFTRAHRMSQIPRTIHRLLRRVDEDRHSSTSRTLQNLREHGNSLFKNIRWCHVDLPSVFAEGVIVRRTFVTQTTIGTFRARATPRCSFDIPIKPAFPPTINMT